METWRDRLRKNFTSRDALADFLQLSEDQKEQLLSSPHFSWNVPLRLAEKMQKGTLEDPLLRQFAALKEELVEAAGFKEDPVKDACFQKTPSLLQKYATRALLISTSACAMHCRFCFRQDYAYESIPKDFKEELDWVRSDQTVDELILSGGDPLSLSERVLEALFEELKTIRHLKRVRFHTRFPIGIPERIDARFLSLLSELPFQVWFLIHCNHPLELDQEVMQSLDKIRRLGIPILSQTVLLKGVNDDEGVLEELFRNFVNAGITPYYLHQLDRVRGAAHFEVPVARGLELMRHLEQSLPGYAVPKYVQEIPHRKSKTVLHS
jgi:EF-P beta-lysylation protein EpmB